MRTAIEMYKFVLDNNYGRGVTKKWGIKHFEIIEGNLSDDEVVKLCFMGMGNAQNDYFSYVITDKRIMIGQKRLVGEYFQTVFLNHLNDVSYQGGALFGTITNDTMKEKFSVRIDKESAKRINEAVNETLRQLRQKESNPEPQKPTNNPIDEIKGYKELLDSGIITQEEFDAKKKQLLDL